MRAKALEPPEEPVQDVMRVLEGFNVDPPAGAPTPRWLRTVVQNRDVFIGTALVVPDENQLPNLAYMMLFGLQNPAEAMFLPMRRVENVQPADPEELRTMLDRSLTHPVDTWQHVFEYDLDAYASGHDLDFDDEGDDLFSCRTFGWSGTSARSATRGWSRSAPSARPCPLRGRSRRPRRSLRRRRPRAQVTS